MLCEDISYARKYMISSCNTYLFQLKGSYAEIGDTACRLYVTIPKTPWPYVISGASADRLVLARRFFIFWLYKCPKIGSRTLPSQSKIYPSNSPTATPLRNLAPLSGFLFVHPARRVNQVIWLPLALPADARSVCIERCFETEKESGRFQMDRGTA